MRSIASAILAMACGTGVFAQTSASWTTAFAIDKREFSAAGRNPYFVLEPGYTLVLEGGKTRLIVTVLNETLRVDDVETRVVEERETENDALVEVSRNFFAISLRSNAVFYFGEDVDEYKNGKVASHGGAWRAGVNGAAFGMMMPGDPLLGARFYQEVAPKVAMDRAQIVSLNTSVTTPAGAFTNCLKTEETTPLEPGVKEYKLYARGIGLVQDGSLKLVRSSK